jgi:hypothetical protein
VSVRRVEGAALDERHVGVAQRRADALHDLLALPGADRDRDLAVGGQAPVGEQLHDAADGGRPQRRRQREGDHPG